MLTDNRKLYQDEILSGTRCGIQAWADHGIGTSQSDCFLDLLETDQDTVGRGVLIDYWRYCQKHNKTYDPTTTYRISLSELLACAKEQGTTFKYGDILIIRSGYIYHYNRLDQEARAAIKGEGIYDFTFVGVKVDDEMLDFLHDNYFAAVAGDAPAFESWPSAGGTNAHTFLLPCWGCPIGEMFDLEKLSEVCEKRNRYHFFFTSSPANVPGEPYVHQFRLSSRLILSGGVGSHPNAMAIF